MPYNQNVNESQILKEPTILIFPPSSCFASFRQVWKSVVWWRETDSIDMLIKLEWFSNMKKSNVIVYIRAIEWWMYRNAVIERYNAIGRNDSFNCRIQWYDNKIRNNSYFCRNSLPLNSPILIWPWLIYISGIPIPASNGYIFSLSISKRTKNYIVSKSTFFV